MNKHELIAALEALPPYFSVPFIRKESAPALALARQLDGPDQLLTAAQAEIERLRPIEEAARHLNIQLRNGSKIYYSSIGDNYYLRENGNGLGRDFFHAASALHQALTSERREG